MWTWILRDILILRYIDKTRFYLQVSKSLLFVFPAPAVDVSNDKSEFVKQELSKSDRPDLASARIVISGGSICIL